MLLVLRHVTSFSEQCAGQLDGLQNRISLCTSSAANNRMLFNLLLRTDDGEMVHAPLCDMAAASPIIFKMLSQVTGISTLPMLLIFVVVLGICWALC